MRRLVIVFISSLFLTLPAMADPFRIQDVKSELEAFGAKGVTLAILFGQPTIRGAINRFGFQVGLRKCSRMNLDEDLYCYEAAFKSCVQILPVHERDTLLDYANNYNKSRRRGTVYVEKAEYLGNLMCVKTTSDFEHEDIKFDVDYVYAWEQMIEDFRSFIVYENISLVDESVL